MSYLRTSLVVSFLSACTHTETAQVAMHVKREVKSAEQGDVTHQPPWVNVSVEEAFDLAKAQNKPVFLYWGAVWCPPCNEVKSEIFSKQNFKDTMTAAIPVYLNGDSENAQAWADKLSVTGYPTMILFTPQRQEVFRLSETSNAKETEDAIHAAMASLIPFQEILNRALAGKASTAEWRILAATSWEQIATVKMSAAARLATKLKLALKAPANIVDVRAKFAAMTLAAAANEEEAKNPAFAARAKEVKRQADKLLGFFLDSPEAIVSARVYIIAEAGNIMKYLYGAKKSDAKTEQRFLAAAETLKLDESLSVDTRLWAHYPALAFAETAGGEDDKGKIPDAIKADIRAAVKAADAAAQTKFQRQSVMSGAANLLARIGDVEAARNLLIREAEASDSPYYYQIDLAMLELKEKRMDEAMRWSEKARKSSVGPATRIQWITSDFSVTLKTGRNDTDERMADILKDYYETALQLSDGFSGRNGARADSLARKLKPLMSKPKLKAVVQAYRQRCSELSGEQKQNCSKHFTSLF